MSNSRFSTLYSILNTKHRGQSLLEALLSIALGVILIGSSVGLIGLSLKSFNSVKQHLQANSLLRQASEVIISLARDNWHFDTGFNCDSTIGCQIKAPSTSTTWTILVDKATSTIDNIPYKQYFRVYNVLRSGGNIAASGDNDPSTQKITIFLEYGNNYVSSSSLSFYLTRSYNNQVFQQTDWSGGSGQTGPISNPGNKFATSTNINCTSTPDQITLAATTSPGELISSILDTGVSGGAGFNSAFATGTWDGIGSVKIQIAFSNSVNGPWDYYAYLTSNAWSTSPNPDWSLVKELLENTSLPFATIGSASPQNERYIRYKVYLSTTGTSPRIDDIIINWSP